MALIITTELAQRAQMFGACDVRIGEVPSFSELCWVEERKLLTAKEKPKIPVWALPPSGYGSGAYGDGDGYGYGSGAYGAGSGAYGAGSGAYGYGSGAGDGDGYGSGAYGAGSGAYGAGSGAYGDGAYGAGSGLKLKNWSAGNEQT